MEINYLVALSLVPGVGSMIARALVVYFGSAKAVFEASKGKLLKVPGVGEIISNEILKKETLHKANELVEEAQKIGIEIIAINNPRFPSKLKEIPDAPLFLYWHGELNPNFDRAIAIVGTRQATEYGRSITEKIISELVVYKPIIISGFAYGIDIVAHKAALANGLPTVAVLGGGLGKIYPAQHKKYIDDVIKNGAMVSEYSYKTEPSPMHFPARNRIVAGMVDAVIVIEAAESGGALITAEIASSYDRDVFAVPGNIGSKYSEGCNKLIANNTAQIFSNVNDLASALNWISDGTVCATKPKLDLSELSVSQIELFKILEEKGDMHIDTLSWQAQMNMNQIASLLLDMEIKGLVKPLPGKKFKLA